MAGGLLGAIGQGLKLGAGVMNPEIYAQQEQERAQSRLDAKQRQADLAKFIMTAAQSGAIPSEQARLALSAIDKRLAEQIPEIALQPGMEAQKAAFDFRQSQQDREGISQLAVSLGLDKNAPKDVVLKAYEAQNPKQQQFAPSEMEKLLAARDKAAAAGNAAAARALDARIAKLTTITQPPGMLPPAGYQFANGGLAPIPGGPYDPATLAAAESAKASAREQAEAAAAAPKMAEKARQQVVVMDNMIGTIDEAIGKVGPMTAGVVGKALSNIPQTPAYELGRVAETIKANIGFDRLQQMRDASPTGGALGQVAIQELVALQNSIASLDQGQGPAKLRANLQKVKQHYENWKRTVMQAQAQGGMTVAPPDGGGWSIRPVP